VRELMIPRTPADLYTLIALVVMVIDLALRR
jgi:hypothetical protein